MESIIEELKQEHEELRRILQAAIEIGIASKAGQAKLLSMRELLMSHLQKENDEIYVPLKMKAVSDRELARVLDPFFAKLEEIPSFAAEFFERLERDGASIELARSAGRLAGMIRNRIHQAEYVVFSEFEKLKSAAA